MQYFSFLVTKIILLLFVFPVDSVNVFVTKLLIVCLAQYSYLIFCKSYIFISPMSATYLRVSIHSCTLDSWYLSFVIVSSFSAVVSTRGV